MPMPNSSRPTPAFGHPSQEGTWGNIPSSGGVRSPQENGGRVDYVPINISEWYKASGSAQPTHHPSNLPSVQPSACAIAAITRSIPMTTRAKDS